MQENCEASCESIRYSILLPELLTVRFSSVQDIGISNNQSAVHAAQKFGERDWHSSGMQCGFRRSNKSQGGALCFKGALCSSSVQKIEKLFLIAFSMSVQEIHKVAAFLPHFCTRFDARCGLPHRHNNAPVSEAACCSSERTNCNHPISWL